MVKRTQRYTLHAGRLIKDANTGDMMTLHAVRGQNGGLAYDPTRLDTLARRIVDLLNAAESKPA